MEELNEYTEKQEKPFNFKLELQKYLIYWKWLVLGLLLGGLAAYLYNRYTIPKYKTEASMMIVDDQEKNVMSALPSGGGSVLALDNSSLGNQIETLRSIQLVELVVDELNHNISYYIEGNIITVEAYNSSPIIVEFLSPRNRVNNLSKSFSVIPESGNTFTLVDESSNYSETHTIGEVINLNGIEFVIVSNNGAEEDAFRNKNTVHVKISPLRQVSNNYISNLQIDTKGESQDILSLSLIQESSGKAEDFLNQLMVEFNEDGVQDKRQVADSTAAFVQDRLRIITSELDSVETGMAQFKRENRIMDVGTGAQEFSSRSSAAEQEIFQLETQLVLINSVQDLLQNSDGYELLPSEIGIEESSISGVVSTYNTLVQERNARLRNATPEHPLVQSITSQLDALQDNLEDNIQSTIRSINVRLGELNQRENRAENLFSTFPGLERGIRNIERQQQIKEQLYLFLLQRREEAAISSAATSSVAKVIDPAYTSKAPVGPKPYIILIGGLVIGLLIPLLVIFVKNMLDTKVHEKEDLQPLISRVPFIGDVPHIAEGENFTIQKNDRSVLAESFRILRTNLNYLKKGRGNNTQKIIFVTSTVKGEGKTFVAYNLARTLATSGKKVLLIGADIRNPQLHRYVENVKVESKGLSEYIYNEDLRIGQIVHKYEDDVPLDLILSGRIPPNPAELLMSSRMEQLLNEVKEKYDHIIVDTAPTMAVTDTLLISQFADTTIYVTRAGYTEKGILDFAKELYDEGKLKGMAVVMNDLNYSKYGYAAKYGYNYGYGREEPKGLKKYLKKFSKSKN